MPNIVYLNLKGFRYNNSKNIKRSLLNFNKIDKNLYEYQDDVAAKNLLRFNLVNII